jgi:transglutaminase-like putative cysteine protease
VSEEIKVSLEPTPFIQSDHPEIQAKAREIVSPDDSGVTKANQLMKWVNENVQKRPVLSVPNALEILHNRVGDCNEHAVLLAALCRASGIPAQSVTSLGGLIYMTLCIGFIGTVVVLEAGPVYNVFMTGIRGAELSGFQWMWLVGSFSLVLFLCMMAVWIPMRLGERKILERI